MDFNVQRKKKKVNLFGCYDYFKRYECRCIHENRQNNVQKDKEWTTSKKDKEWTYMRVYACIVFAVILDCQRT